MSRLFIVEHLTLRAWFGTIRPEIHKRQRDENTFAGRVCVLDCAPWTWSIIQWSAKRSQIPIAILDFRLLDVRDEKGLLLRLRIAYQDLAEVQEAIIQGAPFQRYLHQQNVEGNRRSYLEKSLVTISLWQRGTLWRALLLIQIAAWRARHSRPTPQETVLFIERRPWFEYIAVYAQRFHVSLITLPRSFDKFIFKQWFVPTLPAVLRDTMNTIRHHGWSWRAWQGIGQSKRKPPQTTSAPPRLAVEYYGQLNLDRPELYSDLFFWQQSDLPAEDLVVLFGLPGDPLDKVKYADLKKHHLSAAVLRPEASVIQDVPIYSPSRTPWIWPRRALEQMHFKNHEANFHARVLDWMSVFEGENIKLYLSWFKYDASHIAITEAIQRLGGISAIYQRAYDSHPSAEMSISADLIFGYSPYGFDLEKRSRSLFRYFIATGYFGDHRFALLKPQAQALRDHLQKKGAKRIVSFTDEGSGDDARWHTGHQLPREAYGFLLEKVLSQPWFGLILKPKVPSSIRKRLGPVADLLKRAEATGRCMVYEQGTLHGSVPPVAAALSADVHIHGHMCAATAAMEAALAGVPTLLMDREGWSVSPLQRLGQNRVVFQDWEALWQVCEQQWFKTRVPGFGDWSPLLDELDPFRDGRAAERVGTYLTWLIEGLKGGRNRETIMADAATRYAATWGADKVIPFDAPVLDQTTFMENAFAN